MDESNQKQKTSYFDDKVMVIIGLVALGIFLCFSTVPQGNISLINSIISGLLGAAVGRGLK